MIYATDKTFSDEVLNASTPVLVDFYADWCPPCQMIAPLLDELAEDYAGKAKVVKVNVDDNPKLSAQYGIRNIPTLMTFKAGQMTARHAGAMPKSALAQLIDKEL